MKLPDNEFSASRAPGPILLPPASAPELTPVPETPFLPPTLAISQVVSSVQGWFVLAFYFILFFYFFVCLLGVGLLVFWGKKPYH